MDGALTQPETEAGRAAWFPDATPGSAVARRNRLILAIEAEARASERQVWQQKVATLSHELAVRDQRVEALEEALRAIADARQRISECPTPFNCMYPQHHWDDESDSGFAWRLQRAARDALLASPALSVPEGNTTGSIELRSSSPEPRPAPLMSTVDRLAPWAVRYALGRSTYAVADVVDTLMACRIGSLTATTIVADIDKAEERGALGMEMDAAAWRRLRAALTATAKDAPTPVGARQETGE